MRFKLFVGCVDGDTFYVLGTSSNELALNFLNRYDHEGSTVSLEIWPEDIQATERLLEITDPERVYDVLKTGKL